MRLLHVTQSYYPFFDRGGPTVKVRALARGLASSGHAVTVLTADLGFDEAKRETAAQSRDAGDSKRRKTAWKRSTFELVRDTEP